VLTPSQPPNHYIIIIYLHSSKIPSPSRRLRSVRCRVYRQHVISETNRYIKNYTRKTTKATTITAVRPPLFSADAAPCVAAGGLFVAEAVLLPCVGFRVLEGRVEEVVITDPFEVEVPKDPFGVEADRRAILVLDHSDTRLAPADFSAVPEGPLVVSLVVFDDSSVVLDGFSVALPDFLVGSFAELLVLLDARLEIVDDRLVLVGRSVGIRVFVALLELPIVLTFFFKVLQ